VGCSSANYCGVGERSVVGRSHTVRSGGRGGSENAGISSEKTGENPVRRKPKGSSGRFVLGRLVGPKLNPNGVGDGCTVDIP
jgi:hypothetical protein